MLDIIVDNDISGTWQTSWKRAVCQQRPTDNDYRGRIRTSDQRIKNPLVEKANLLMCRVEGDRGIATVPRNWRKNGTATHDI
jgi:hypothetical protein